MGVHWLDLFLGLLIVAGMALGIMAMIFWADEEER